MKALEPAGIWNYFDEILQIPRISKHEEKIIAYLEKFAREQKLDFKKDIAGNCLISKPATAGFEDRATMILQSHLDMVGEKLTEVDHDFSTDPIKSRIVDGWMMAEGTTLGADDGIGIAASMAILAADDLKHGPIECLFTADEETGMTGAFGLKEGFLKGNILLNLDSEDEGEIFVGCAGGVDTIALFEIDKEPVPEVGSAMRIIVDGLQGGHSGDEIHKGFGNSIKIMNRLLWNLTRQFGCRVSGFEAGKLRNAIPRDAISVIVYEPENHLDVVDSINEYMEIIKGELGDLEPTLEIVAEPVEMPEEVWRYGFQDRLLHLLYAAPHGVIGWSRSIHGLVETSTNLAMMRQQEGELKIVTSQRSSSESAKKDIADRMDALFTLAGGDVEHSYGYPGWSPNMDSVILKKAAKVYKELFDQKPDVKAIHAGLECGLFLEKYPHLDMISFGPTIKGAHTPEERLEIETVKKFWDFTIRLLEEAPKA